VSGLQTGADDYLPKPFDPQELVARVQAILRRSHMAARPASNVVRVGDVVLDYAARSVRRGEAAVELTAAEFDLLRVLLLAAGRVVSREDLFRKVLGREFSVFDRGIDNHVSSLRKKLGAQPDGSERIKAVRGVGYVYSCPETREAGGA
jgi:two-component system response regulator CpxR